MCEFVCIFIFESFYIHFSTCVVMEVNVIQCGLKACHVTKSSSVDVIANTSFVSALIFVKRLADTVLTVDNLIPCFVTTKPRLEANDSIIKCIYYACRV